MKKRALAEFFHTARRECCNYRSTGPGDRNDYCWLEPTQTDYRCLLSKDILCKWFVAAILPEHPRLTNMYTAGAAVGATLDNGKSKPCGKCAKPFKVKSNRQTLCPECQKNQKKALDRERSRKHRQKKGTPSRFSDDE